MPNHEWQVLPLLRSLADNAGQVTFVLAHVPIFAIVIACVASLNLKIRSLARDIASAFLVVHAILHFAFSGHPAYAFESLLSNGLIYGAAVCGAVYLLMRWTENRTSATA